jgi:hypothetical protein
MTAPEIGDRLNYEGAQRQIRGRLTYGRPPEPGTLVGPNGWSEACVVLGTVGGVTLIGLATAADVERARAVIAATGPRSRYEIGLA